MERVKRVDQGTLNVARVGQNTANGVRIDAAVVEWQGATYAGSYEVTPSLETQTLPTYGKLLTENVVVNPVPDNYGLITWDGSKLRIS